MTQRLYFDDPYRTDFEATVVKRTEVDGKPGVFLDQTCFYPTGGGQGCDQGFLNDVPVVHVLERHGEILHVLSNELHQVDYVEFCRDDSHLLSIGGGLIKLWEVETGQLVLSLKTSDFIIQYELSPDGRCLLTASANNVFRLWRLDDHALGFVTGEGRRKQNHDAGAAPPEVEPLALHVGHLEDLEIRVEPELGAPGGVPPGDEFHLRAAGDLLAPFDDRNLE